jgi:predicted DsbA family dithiol-disulfide isomerase
MDVVIKVDVWSDIACPWCYVGKRRLEAGIEAFRAEHPGLDVDVEYHSFELSPETPVDYAGSEVDFLRQHKGVPETQARAMIARITGIAAEVGLRYDFDALQHTNTLKAHQLLHYAKAHGHQREAVERLMSAYFVEGRHIGRDESLAELAAEIGLDREDVLRSLATEEHLPAVRDDQARAAGYGIAGVPFYVIDGRYGLSGAQPPEAFTEVLRQVAGERTAVSP